MSLNKFPLIAQLVSLMEAEISVLQKSLESASEAATHPEAKPENKYDTRGLEASYLAGAQRERLGELKAAVALLQSMALRAFGEEDRIAPTAIVTLEHEGRATHYFVLPLGAGFTVHWDAESVVVVTPQSPLGKALIGKTVGDEVKVRMGTQIKQYEVMRVW